MPPDAFPRFSSVVSALPQPEDIDLTKEAKLFRKTISIFHSFGIDEYQCDCLRALVIWSTGLEANERLRDTWGRWSSSETERRWDLWIKLTAKGEKYKRLIHVEAIFGEGYLGELHC